MGEDRGASAVEFALVLPILGAFLFGIIEFSLFMKNHVSATSSVRTAARVASAGAGAGDCRPGPTAPCPSARTTPALAQDAADAIARAGTAMPKDAIEELWIYKANKEGFPGPDGLTTFTNCTSKCVRYRWSAAANRFAYVSGSWDSATINACLNSPTSEAVGVFLRARHDAITGLPFLQPDQVEDRAVMKFEPLPSGSCNGTGNPATGGHA